MGGVWYKTIHVLKVLTIKWKCLKIHLLIFCVIDSQADSFWIVMTHKPHPSGTPCTLKQTKDIFTPPFDERVPATLVVNLVTISHLICRCFQSRCSATLQVSFETSTISLSVQKENRNLLKCLWQGKGVLYCTVPMSLSETVMRELLKMANAAQTDKSEPHVTVHACFGSDSVHTHTY